MCIYVSGEDILPKMGTGATLRDCLRLFELLPLEGDPLAFLSTQLAFLHPPGHTLNSEED